MLRQKDRNKRRRILDPEALGGGMEMADPPAPVPGGDVLPTSAADLVSLEFSLTHNLTAMAKACRRDLTSADIFLLKVSYPGVLAAPTLSQIILAAGLYPNVAVPDGGNSHKCVVAAPRRLMHCRPQADHLFHSLAVTELQGHPSSVFGAQPGLISGARDWQPTRDCTRRPGVHLRVAA